MFAGTLSQCKIGFMKIVQITEKIKVTIVLKIVETTTESLTPS